MTHFIADYEFEIIEQLASGNWVVRDVNTGKISEVSDYFLTRMNGKSYRENGKKLAAMIENGYR